MFILIEVQFCSELNISLVVNKLSKRRVARGGGGGGGGGMVFQITV